MIIKRKELLKALTIAGSVIPSKAILSVITETLITFEGSNISVIGTDLDNTIVYKFSSEEVFESAEVVVDYKDLKELLSSIDDDNVDVLINKKDNTIVISYGLGGRFELPYVDGEDYPKPLVDGNIEKEYYLSKDDLYSVISTLKNFTNKDDLRPIMQCVNFDFDGESLNATATNSHILMNMKMFSNQDHTGSFLLHKNSFSAILHFPNEEVNIIDYSNFIVLSSGNITMYHTKRTGNFPAWRSVIPSEYANTVTFAKEELKKATKLCSIGDPISIKLEVEKTFVSFTGTNIDLRKESKYKVNIEQKENEESVILGFNPKFLAEVLSVIPTAAVTIGLNPSRACRFFHEENTIILMPVLIK